MVKSFQDNNKAHCRAKLVDFIRYHYTPAQLALATYVCFPGKEMLEIREVTDKLGIRRENVFGIERDKTEYGAICEQNQKIGTPINTFLGTDLEFLTKTNIRPNIISLDYCGTWSREKHDLIGTIFERPVLTDHNGIVAINLLAQRENEDAQEYIEGQVRLQRSRVELFRELCKRRGVVPLEGLPDAPSGSEPIEDPLRYRDEVVIRTLIAQSIRRGTRGRNATLFSKFSGYQRLLSNLKQFVQDEYDKADTDEARAEIAMYLNDPLKDSYLYSVLEGIVSSYLPSPGESPARKKTFYDSVTFFQYLMAEELRSFFPTHHERYRYVSTTRHAMNSEFVHFERPEIFLSDRNRALVYATLVTPFLAQDQATKDTITRVLNAARGRKDVFELLVHTVKPKHLRRTLREVAHRRAHEKLITSMHSYYRYLQEAHELKKTPRYLLSDGDEYLIETASDVTDMKTRPITDWRQTAQDLPPIDPKLEARIVEILADKELGVRDHDLLEIYGKQGLTPHGLYNIKQRMKEVNTPQAPTKPETTTSGSTTPTTTTPTTKTAPTPRKKLSEAIAEEIKALIHDSTCTDDELLSTYQAAGLTHPILAGYKAARSKELNAEIMFFIESGYTDEEIIGSYASMGITGQKLAALRSRVPKVACFSTDIDSRAT
ncbi:hypothetical protein HZB03_02485 [Candidatus Woesearchaeota archaeon]|nr:hypothetical protein [Candidatus Woesearchaeota archaeon]